MMHSHLVKFWQVAQPKGSIMCNSIRMCINQWIFNEITSVTISSFTLHYSSRSDSLIKSIELFPDINHIYTSWNKLKFSKFIHYAQIHFVKELFRPPHMYFRPAWNRYLCKQWLIVDQILLVCCERIVGVLWKFLMVIN